MISVGVRSQAQTHQAKHRPSVCSQSDMGQSYLLESLVSEDNSILLGRLASEGKFILLESLGASAASLDSTVASPRWPLSTAVLPPPCPGCSPGIVGQLPICRLSFPLVACLALEKEFEAFMGTSLRSE